MSSSNFSSLLSPYRESRRIPPGEILAEIPLDTREVKPLLEALANV